MGKTFALLGSVGGSFDWFMVGTYDEAMDAMAAAVATHDEDDTFMVVRVFAHRPGGLHDGSPV